jgi:hypothetical protein
MPEAKDAVRQLAYRIGLWRHRRRASHDLRMFEALMGSRLPAATQRAAEAYAGDVLGSRHYAPWLCVYAQVRGSFQEGWIPADFFDLVVMRHVNRRYRQLSQTKSFTGRLLRDPAIPDVGSLIHGRYYDPQMRPIPLAEVAATIFATTAEVFVKDDGGAESRYVHLYAQRTFDPARVAREHPNAVLQRRIHDHPALQRLFGGSGSKLRVMTVRSGEQPPRNVGAYLTLPRRGATHTEYQQSHWVAVDRELGVTRGVYRDRSIPDGHHRDTGVPLDGHPIPGYHEAVRRCEVLHRRVPHLAVIGWDVMIDEAEAPWIIEWNTRIPNIFMIEAFTGPAFLGLGWHALRWSAELH